MVRIEKGILTIEVNCENENPLQLLSEYQYGILSAIHACSHLDSGALHSDPGAAFSQQMLLYRLTNLFKELMINPEQCGKMGSTILSQKEVLYDFNSLSKVGDH